MKSIKKILMATILLLLVNVLNAQIKNSVSKTIKVFGNCETCKKNIEKAGNVKKVASVTWNQDTKQLVMNFDSKITSEDEILKRIALAGYDSEHFIAPNEAYHKLDPCCQYERIVKKTTPKPVENKVETATVSDTNQLLIIMSNYFILKDAFVLSGSELATKAALGLSKSLEKLKMESLKANEHVVWMKVEKTVKSDVSNIINAKDLEKQRSYFISLSQNMYELAKVVNLDKTVYYQHCPMANDGKGANWLSKENAVKNPYYGNMMLTCGKTVETIK